MTIEEKAKAYDEALERARKELQACGSTDCDAARQIFRFFPELQESEDELMWLTKYIEEEAYSLSIDLRDNEDRIKLKNLQRSPASLEKQGEQKAVDSSQTCKMETLMTLDKAIEHCKEKSCDDTACGKEHKQLAEWLTELKGYRCSVTQEAHKPADKVEPK